MIYYFFFFACRRRHTSWPRDWSSDVCSSDLTPAVQLQADMGVEEVGPGIGYDELIGEGRLRLDGVLRHPRHTVGRIVQSNAMPVDQIGRASCRERVWMSVVGRGQEIETDKHECER